jgi:hypothetical protein
MMLEEIFVLVSTATSSYLLCGEVLFEAPPLVLA